MSNDPVRDDWPFGPELKRRREHAGLSQRAASRRTTPAGETKPVISAGRWPQLETGWQKNKGARIPIGTTPATVAAAARAVDWDINDALQLAGFSPATVTAEFSGEGTLATAIDLKALSDEELLAEIRERMRGVRNVVETTAQSDAPSKAKAEEVSLDQPHHGTGLGRIEPHLTREGVGVEDADDAGDEGSGPGLGRI
jgi:hypothetical protein